jgi:acyl dehydratase
MAIDPSAVVGKELPAQTFEYNERDLMLYALGVGCTTDELPFIYEKNLKVLPTFAVVPAFPVMMGIGQVVEINPVMVLHGEQRIDLRAPIPTKGKLTTGGKISAVYDKGSGAVIVVDSETKDEGGTLLFVNRSSIFVRGAGGFGGERGPSASSKNVPPEKRPDHVVEYKTLPQQAAIYRLSGDRNPLHIDPEFAKMAGFNTPILHGLCTFGHVGRAVLHSCCGGDPARFKSFEVRFAGVVYPGETIVTEIWRDSGSNVIVQAKAAERNEVVIANAAATIA